jgi:hypothetical protein
MSGQGDNSYADRNQLEAAGYVMRDVPNPEGFDTPWWE